MKITADYHTHTIFSHGKGTILDNALSAKKKGLTEIAISDHGFSHPAFGLSKRKLPKMQNLCKQASLNTGVNVLMGIESNIIGVDGTIDLKKENYDDFDVLLAGVHKFVFYKPRTFFSLFIPNLINDTLNFKNVSKSLIKENTKTYINVIKNNPVDVITHINFGTFSDSLEVAKAAGDYGTYIELNAKKVHLSIEEISNILAKTSANFVVNSDAHSPNRVGEISLVEKILSGIDFDMTRIHNINGRVPNFRFKKFKETSQK